MRIVLFGNAGSGKTTMARVLARDGAVPILSLDAIAWEPDSAAGPVRRPLAESVAELDAFLAAHDEWIVEGCYADLIEPALAHATELRFLDPGVETCVARCRSRPHEPDKFATPEEQAAVTETLIAWVREYETRDDEYGRARHRRLFETFPRKKRRFR